MSASRPPGSVPGHRPKAPPSAVGRGDLVRARGRGGATELAALAEVLGYEHHPGEKKQAESLEEQSAESPGTAATEVADPGEAPAVAQSFPLWRPVAVDRRENREETSGRGGALPLDETALRVPEASDPPSSPPIVPWPRLWRVLAEELRTPRPRREIDVPRLVDSWGRGEEVHRLPYMPGLRHARVVLIVDRSPRLQPFFADQAAVVRRLVKELGPRAVRFLPTPGGLSWPASFAVDEDQVVLVFTDLGLLAGPEGETIREAWLHLGRGLARSGRPGVALTVCPPRRWQPTLTEPSVAALGMPMEHLFERLLAAASTLTFEVATWASAFLEVHRTAERSGFPGDAERPLRSADGRSSIFRGSQPSTMPRVSCQAMVELEADDRRNGEQEAESIH